MKIIRHTKIVFSLLSSPELLGVGGQRTGASGRHVPPSTSPPDLLTLAEVKPATPRTRLTGTSLLPRPPLGLLPRGEHTLTFALSQGLGVVVVVKLLSLTSLWSDLDETPSLGRRRLLASTRSTIFLGLRLSRGRPGCDGGGLEPGFSGVGRVWHAARTRKPSLT